MPRVARVPLVGAGLVLAVACAFLAATSRHLRADDARRDWRPPPAWFDFDAGRPIALDVRSPAVERRGERTHLVTIGRLTFHLDPRGGLTATARAAVTCAEDVEY